MVNENADKKDQNSGNDDDDDQGVAAENECKNSVNVLHYNISLSFDIVEGKSEEEKIKTLLKMLSIIWIGSKWI